MIADARPAPGDIVLLPEMFDSGFSFALDVTADHDGATADFLHTLARDLRVTVVAGRTVVGHDRRGRNRCTVVGPSGEVLTEYDKVHLFSIGREHEAFGVGTRVTSFAWGGLRCAPAICYDLRFPEVFRAGLAQGAECFVVVAQWLSARAAHWPALLVARAIENQAFVLAVNRCGRDPNSAYPGLSMAVGPTGEVLAHADEREQVLSVAIDAAQVRAWREKFPAWREAGEL
jgi:predicted amidohydrolase